VGFEADDMLIRRFGVIADTSVNRVLYHIVAIAQEELVEARVMLFVGGSFDRQIEYHE
jgi:hypothetical protein